MIFKEGKYLLNILTFLNKCDVIIYLFYIAGKQTFLIQTTVFIQSSRQKLHFPILMLHLNTSCGRLLR